MNSDLPPTPPDNLETRITALLLGELTPTEAAEVRAAIAQDPALAQLHDRLKRTIGFVQEAQAPASAPPRLAESRRQKLLSQFKMLAPKELRARRWRSLRWLVPMSAAAALVLLVGALLPSFTAAKAKTQRSAALSRQQEEVLRERLLVNGGTAPTDATTLALSSAGRAREVADQVTASDTTLQANSEATATRSLERWGDSSTPAQRSLGIESLGRSGAAAAPDSAAGTKPAASSPPGEIDLPKTEPAADSYAASGPGDREATAPADAATEAARPKMMDVRMMMRYGLVPKGIKNELAREVKRQPAAEEQVPSRGATESAGVSEEIAAKSELAPLPLKLPIPAFMGTPTDIPTESEGKERLAEQRGIVAGGLGGGGGMGGGAGGYGGFGGAPPAANVAKPTEQPATGGRRALPALAQSVEGRAGIAAGTVAVGKDMQPGLAGTAGAVIIAPADNNAAVAEPAEGVAQTESNRGRMAGNYAFKPASPKQDKTTVLGDTPTLGRLFGSGPSQAAANAPAAGPAPAAQPPTAPARQQVQVVDDYIFENGRVKRVERLPTDVLPQTTFYFASGQAETTMTDPGSVPQSNNAWYLQGAAPVAPAAPAENGQLRSFFSADGATPAGGGQPVPPVQARGDFDNAGLLDLAVKPAGRKSMNEGLGEFSKALAKADQVVQGLEPAVASQPAGEVRLRGELRATEEAAAKTKSAERNDATGVALGYATSQYQALATNSLALTDELEKLSDSRRSKFGLVADAKAAKASAVNVPALKGIAVAEEAPVVRRKLAASEPQPEVVCAQNPFSTFSLNVTDVSFKLAAASLEQGQMPDPATVRSEEFLNAFNYHDPAPAPGVPVAFAWERAQYPFAQNRDMVRFSVQTAARGREAARPLNLVLLLDNSGSMERSDRVSIIHEALGVLASQLHPQDTVSVVAFARTARLWVDGLAGSQAGELIDRVGNLTPEGGTNLEDALNLAYETALRHFLGQGVNRVVLLTDGAANLGDVDPASLQRKVESYRKRGVALDCFGIGWEGYNDDLLEVLSRHGDGRYGFVNTPEEATTEFAAQLTGALQVAAADVKVQVEFNPLRVTGWRQIGYAKHQLTKEQFRDNTVDAAELAAAESGNALYVVEVNPGGDGDLGTVRVRYREPATGLYRELEWPVPYTGPADPLDRTSPALRLATVAAAFSEWLASSPFAGEVTTDALLADLRGVPEAFTPDPRPTKLEWMIRQAKSIAGK